MEYLYLGMHRRAMKQNKAEIRSNDNGYTGVIEPAGPGNLMGTPAERPELRIQERRPLDHFLPRSVL